MQSVRWMEIAIQMWSRFREAASREIHARPLSTDGKIQSLLPDSRVNVGAPKRNVGGIFFKPPFPASAIISSLSLSDVRKAITSCWRGVEDSRILESFLEVPSGSLTQYVFEMVTDSRFLFQIEQRLNELHRLQQYRFWSWPPRQLLALYA